jgi:ABC-2 type transport system ATP-binding protein
MSSHLIGEVAQVADRVEVMVNGCLIASGTPQEVAQSRAPHAVVVRTTCPAQLRDHLASRGAEVTITGDRLHVIGLDVRQVAAIAKNAPGLVLALQVQDASLEQAYLTIAGAP